MTRNASAWLAIRALLRRGLSMMLLVAVCLPSRHLARGQTTSAPTLPVASELVIGIEQDGHGAADFTVPEASYALVTLRVPLDSVLEVSVTVNGPFNEGNMACDEGFFVRMERGSLPTLMTADDRRDDSAPFFSFAAIRGLIAGSTFCTGAPRLTITDKDTGSTPAVDEQFGKANGTLEYYLVVESRADPARFAPPPTIPGTNGSTPAPHHVTPFHCPATIYVHSTSRWSAGITGFTVLLAAVFMSVFFVREVLAALHNGRIVRDAGYRLPLMSPILTMPLMISETILVSCTHVARSMNDTTPAANRAAQRRRANSGGARRRPAPATSTTAAATSATDPDVQPLAEAEMLTMQDDAAGGSPQPGTAATDASEAASQQQQGGDASAARPPSPGAQSNHSSDSETCRVCREGDDREVLVAPCRCTGSMQYVHPTCLQRWRMEAIGRNPRYTTHCEVCQHELDPGVVPQARAPKFAKLLAHAGVRLAFFGFIAILLILLLGAISVQTVGRSSCFAPWHHADDSFVATLLGGTAMALLIDRVFVAAAFRTASAAGAHSLDQGQAPQMEEGALMRGTLVTALLLVLYDVLLGFSFTRFLWLMSSSVPLSMELRIGNGFVIGVVIAFITYLVHRAMDDGRTGARRRDLPAPLLAGDDADGGPADGAAAEEGEATGVTVTAIPINATQGDLPSTAAPRTAQDVGPTPGSDRVVRAEAPVVVPARTSPVPRSSSTELDDAPETPVRDTAPARPSSTPPPLHEAHVSHM